MSKKQAKRMKNKKTRKNLANNNLNKQLTTNSKAVTSGNLIKEKSKSNFNDKNNIKNDLNTKDNSSQITKEQNTQKSSNNYIKTEISDKINQSNQKGFSDEENIEESYKSSIKREKNHNRLTLLLSLFLILGGIAISLYPNISNYFAEKNQVEIIEKYEELVVSIDNEGLEEEFQKAQTYNENLAGDPVHDPFVEGSGYALPTNYTSILNFTDSGIMAYIEIPKINVHLPIYHGTSSEVLEKGVGHIQSTSLPVGGTSTHCVLTGHTGLPSAELFTRLDELNIGDIFYIHVLNKVLTYKVYETKVILPDDIDELQVVKGKDYITLVTCTPYGVNTHRLLVKAEQVEYEEYVEPTQETNNTPVQEVVNAIEEKDYYYLGYIIGGSILIILFIILITRIILKKLKRKNSKHNNSRHF